MLFCNDVATARNWLGTAFGFETSATHQDADGRVFGAELRLGDARVMLLGGDDEAAMGMRSPRTIGSMTVVGDLGQASQAQGGERDEFLHGGSPCPVFSGA